MLSLQILKVQRRGGRRLEKLEESDPLLSLPCVAPQTEQAGSCRRGENDLGAFPCIFNSTNILLVFFCILLPGRVFPVAACCACDSRSAVELPPQLGFCQPVGLYLTEGHTPHRLHGVIPECIRPFLRTLQEIV